MAETGTTPVVAQPGSGAAAPATQVAVAPSLKAEPGDAGSRTEALEEAFGADPLRGGAGETNKTENAPGAGGDAGAGGEAAPKGEGEPGGENTDTPAPAPLPFDEELSGLTPLDGGDGTDVVAEALPDLSTPEAIAKACNPDGKGTAEQQLQHAQQLLGKHSGLVAEAKKLKADAEKVANTFKPFLTANEKGEFTGFDMLKLGEFMGQEHVDRQLAAAGVKLVPLDWQPAGGAANDGITADVVTALAKTPGLDADVKAALLNNGLSLEEKVELVKGNEDLRLEAKLLMRERQRTAEGTRQATVAQSNQALNQRLDQLAASDKGFKALLPAMEQWNAKLPAEIGGAMRAEVVYRLAKLERLLSPQVRKAQSDAIYQRAEADIIKKFRLTMPGGGGGGVLPGGGRPAAGSPDAALEEAFGG